MDRPIYIPAWDLMGPIYVSARALLWPRGSFHICAAGFGMRLAWMKRFTAAPFLAQRFMAWHLLGVGPLMVPPARISSAIPRNIPGAEAYT